MKNWRNGEKLCEKKVLFSALEKYGTTRVVYTLFHGKTNSSQKAIFLKNFNTVEVGLVTIYSSKNTALRTER